MRMVVEKVPHLGTLGAAVDRVREKLDALNVAPHSLARNWRNLRVRHMAGEIILIADYADSDLPDAHPLFMDDVT